MKRLLLIYNPRSSQYIHIKSHIIDKTTRLKGYMVGKFVIEKAPFESNVARLIKILKDGDLVMAAGGDATAAVVANAILQSDKDITLAVLPYGNFNDLARTLGTRTVENIIRNPKVEKLYPLDIVINNKHWRYATCYVTIGMTAESVCIFDDPEIRQKLQRGYKSSWRSYLELAKWYFKNRHKKQFIPKFTLNGRPQPPKISDYIAVNGRSVSRIMKGRLDYLKPLTFRSGTARMLAFPRLVIFMARSIFCHVPGHSTKGDTLDFIKPSAVSLQAEGEYCSFKRVKRIEIRKSVRFIKVIHE